MKKLLTIIFLFLPISWAADSHAVCPDQNRDGKAAVSRSSKSSQKAMVIRTDELCQDIIGYNGPTPVEITVVNGKITGIKPLPNRESPGYFRMLLNSDFFKSWNGLTLQQAVKKPVDAVTGATYSSRSIIENVRKGAANQLKKNGK